MTITTQRLRWKLLKQLAPVIRDEILKRVCAGSLAVRDILQEVFVALFGEHRSWEEHTLYLLVAAPLARRIVIDLADPDARIGGTDVRVGDLKVWLYWFDSMDITSAYMIDLHYFAGLTFKETAAALGLPLHSVVRDLRFARAWLMVRAA